MNFIDLHCDTLYKAVTQKSKLDNPSYEVKLNNNSNFNKLQCYAIWLPDNLESKNAEKLFFESADYLKSECNRLGIKLFDIGEFTDSVFSKFQNSAFFTVENGKALNGKIENVKRFAELGVRIMTLTWNDKNEIGSGALSNDKCGLTDFGKLAVAEMEKYGIVVDVSHASDELFYDVVNHTNKPFIATHSNSRTITQNPRNLTDEQIKIIIQRGGIIGLNLHNAFLNNNPDKACMEDVLRHCEHILSLGCENFLCFGTDFDGCDLPNDIVGSDSIGGIYELFLKNNYNESILKKIFYENAYKFFENFDNQRIM